MSTTLLDVHTDFRKGWPPSSDAYVFVVVFVVCDADQATTKNESCHFVILSIVHRWSMDRRGWGKALWRKMCSVDLPV
jgi:hypothetical protein